MRLNSVTRATDMVGIGYGSMPSTSKAALKCRVSLTCAMQPQMGRLPPSISSISLRHASIPSRRASGGSSQMYQPMTAGWSFANDVTYLRSIGK